MRLAMLVFLALAIAAVVGVARPGSMDGALSVWEHLAAKVATLR